MSRCMCLCACVSWLICYVSFEKQTQNLITSNRSCRRDLCIWLLVSGTDPWIIKILIQHKFLTTYWWGSRAFDVSRSCAKKFITEYETWRLATFKIWLLTCHVQMVLYTIYFYIVLVKPNGMFWTERNEAICFVNFAFFKHGYWYTDQSQQN